MAQLSPTLRNGQALLGRYRQRDGVDIPVTAVDEPRTHLFFSSEVTAGGESFSPSPPAGPPVALDSRKGQARPATAGPKGLVFSPRQPGRLPSTVKVYPSLAAAFVNPDHGVAAVARVYCLLLAYDVAGSGRLDLDDVRALLTGRDSTWHICGWRRLRQILNDGEGTFWDRHGDGAAVWLRSARRIAAGLNVSRLSGRPVAVPVEQLLAGMGDTRAAFMACWLAGRRHPENPIGRATIADVTGIVPRSQRRYTKRAGVTVARNISVSDEPYTLAGAQDEAWKHGRATFAFVDYHGRRGPRGGRYNAYQMPNAYQCDLEQLPKGRTRKINQQLNLVEQPAQGKQEQIVSASLDEAQAGTLVARLHTAARSLRLYFDDEKRASKGQRAGHVAYWPEGGRLTPNASRPAKFSGVNVWGQLPPEVATA